MAMRFAHEPLDLVERLVAGQRAGRASRGRTAAPRRGAGWLRKDLLEPPARGVGKRQQPQRLAGRRAVDDDRVPVAGLVVALELQQAEQLVHARAARSAPRPRCGRRRARAAARRASPARAAQWRSISSCAETCWAHRPSPSSRRLGRRARARARRRASARGRSTARSCAARRRRSGAPWPPRPTSCRRRPCRCRGWSAGPSRQPTSLRARFLARLSVMTPSAEPRLPARSVASMRTVAVAARLRRPTRSASGSRGRAAARGRDARPRVDAQASPWRPSRA